MSDTPTVPGFRAPEPALFVGVDLGSDSTPPISYAGEMSNPDDPPGTKFLLECRTAASDWYPAVRAIYGETDLEVSTFRERRIAEYVRDYSSWAPEITECRIRPVRPAQAGERTGAGK